MGSHVFRLPFESVQGLLLDLARERDLEASLALVVHRLREVSDVALARVWLVREADICPTCPRRQACAQNVPCLQLSASAGAPSADSEADWSRLDGDFCRFPIGDGKIGSVAATTAAVCVEDTRRDAAWIARPEWASREGILGFGGQPLVFHGEVLGVLGVFTRACFGGEALAALRMVADHVAAALANARAFATNAQLRQQLEAENTYLRDDLSNAQAFGEMIGVSGAIREVQEKIEQVAPTDASVLVLGESGTGKELVAREIHDRSERHDRPMIRVNCASVPRELYESEFFGHVKGAFTGAVRDRVGRFAAADGGTLLLDEVGEIPPELQSKLLRVLQEGQYERVGDDRTRSVDVRVVAATNRDLAREVEEGRFRADLFYRLNVFPIELPPLRKRTEDIRLLAAQFLERVAQKMKRHVRLTEADVDALQRYDWPGNIRELQNVLERAVITAKGERLELRLPAREARDSATPPSMTERVLTDAQMREFERSNLIQALERAGGRVYGDGGAADLLGLKPTTVASRLQRLGIRGAGTQR